MWFGAIIPNGIVMPTIELTDDEFATLRDAFDDVGCDCPGVDWDKFKALGVKLGFWEAEKPLTEEELKRREELANSPYGKMMAELMKTTNDYLIDNKDMLFYRTGEWDTISNLRIKLPNDYHIKENK